MTPPPSEIRQPAALASLPVLLAFVLAHAEAAGFASSRRGEIELVLEEVLVNVFNYAYDQTPGEVAVSCALEADGRLRVEVVDRGVPFDPLARQDPDLEADLASRGVGGLGIYFVRRLVGDVRYRREAGKNILTLRIGAAAPAAAREAPR